MLRCLAAHIGRGPNHDGRPRTGLLPTPVGSEHRTERAGDEEGKEGNPGGDLVNAKPDETLKDDYQLWELLVDLASFEGNSRRVVMRNKKTGLVAAAPEHDNYSGVAQKAFDPDKDWSSRQTWTFAHSGDGWAIRPAGRQGQNLNAIVWVDPGDGGRSMPGECRDLASFYVLIRFNRTRLRRPDVTGLTGRELSRDQERSLRLHQVVAGRRALDPYAVLGQRLCMVTVAPARAAAAAVAAARSAMAWLGCSPARNSP